MRLRIKFAFNEAIMYNIENKKCDSLKNRRNQKVDL